MKRFKGFGIIVVGLVLGGCASVNNIPGPVGTPTAAAEGMNRVYLVRTEQNIQVTDQLENTSGSSDRRTNHGANLAAFILLAAALSSKGDVSATIGLNSFYYPEPSPRYNHILVDVFSDKDGTLQPLGTFTNRTAARFLDFPVDDHPKRVSISAYSTALFDKEYAPHFDLQAIEARPDLTSVLVLGRVDDDQWGIRLLQLSKEDTNYCRDLGSRSDLTQRQRHAIIQDRATTYIDKTNQSGASSRFHIACSAVVSAESLGPTSDGIIQRFKKHGQGLVTQFNISAEADPDGLAPAVLIPR